MSTIHNPKNFIPENYTVIDYLDSNGPDPMEFFTGNGDATGAAAAFTMAKHQHNRQFAQYFGWTSEDSGVANMPYTCAHCGVRVRYIVVAHHEPTDTNIAMGGDCAGRVDLTLNQHRLRNLKKVAAKRAETIRCGGRYQRLLNEQPELAEAIAKWDESGKHNNFIDDVLMRGRNKGVLSGPQIECVTAAITKQLTWVEERKAEADTIVASGAEIKAGRQVITGKVLSCKTQESMYGISHKWLIQDDSGLKYWGTIPSSIEGTFEELKGTTVELTATVEPKDGDLTFGFYKRPTKASLKEVA